MSHSPSLAQLVARAVQIAGPESDNAALADLHRRFAGASEPVASVSDVGFQINEAAVELDPNLDNPAVPVARAVVLYLAQNPTELDEDPTALLRNAAAAEWAASPPAAVATWLAERDITL